MRHNLRVRTGVGKQGCQIVTNNFCTIVAQQNSLYVRHIKRHISHTKTNSLITVREIITVYSGGCAKQVVGKIQRSFNVKKKLTHVISSVLSYSSVFKVWSVNMYGSARHG